VGLMNDDEIRQSIDRLVAEEHELRAQHQLEPLEEAGAQRLRQIEESLDQCWDLLRQRRAKREFGLNPDDVAVRETSVVEHYRQ
jgi:thioredoxin-like negative regulator of GroEL